MYYYVNVVVVVVVVVVEDVAENEVASYLIELAVFAADGDLDDIAV